MRYLLLLMLASVCLFSCAEGWTDEYKKEYLESCREDARSWARDERTVNDYCNCALERTMQHYKTIEEVGGNADSVQLSAEVRRCRAEVLKQQ